MEYESCNYLQFIMPVFKKIENNEPRYEEVGDNLILHNAIIASPGIRNYSNRNVLKDVEVLCNDEHITQLNNLPITIGHIHNISDTISDDIKVGTVLNPKHDGHHIIADLIFNKIAKDYIKSSQMNQLSLGGGMETIEGDGLYVDKKYNEKCIALRPHHLALVPRGQCETTNISLDTKEIIYYDEALVCTFDHNICVNMETGTTTAAASTGTTKDEVQSTVNLDDVLTKVSTDFKQQMEQDLKTGLDDVKMHVDGTIASVVTEAMKGLQISPPAIQDTSLDELAIQPRAVFAGVNSHNSVEKGYILTPAETMIMIPEERWVVASHTDLNKNPTLQ